MNELRNTVHTAAIAHNQGHEQQDTGLAQIGRFFRHLLEMVIAMMVGMAVWGAGRSLFLEPAGYDDVVSATPELRFGLMAVFMSVPMVLLMRYRGHTWGRGAEMVAAMAAPMAAVVLCWRLGLGDYVPLFSQQSLSLPAHIGMYLGMVLLMLYRRKEYTHPHTAPRIAGAHASS